MVPPFILAHDLGTTGNKVTRFDATGALIGSTFAAYPTAYPHPNWTAQDPADWWPARGTTTQHLLPQSAIHADARATIGRCGPMMVCTPGERQGQPLRACIIWADRRVQGQAVELAERCDAATRSQERLTISADACQALAPIYTRLATFRARPSSIPQPSKKPYLCLVNSPI